MPTGSKSSVGSSPETLADQPDKTVLVDDLCAWLIDQALSEPELETLFIGCNRRIHATGIPLTRAMIGYSTLHPLYRSKTLNWSHQGNVENIPRTFDDQNTTDWKTSPLRHMIDNGITLLRRRLCGSDALLDFPILEGLRDQGFTDYLAYTVPFTDGYSDADDAQGLVGSWATDSVNGFSDAHLRSLIRIQKRLAVAMKVRIKDEIANNVLSAYLGADAGGRVLQGRIRLGDGELLHAVIWYSDMRNSTRLAGELPHADFLVLLNNYFHCTAGAVLAEGGEVLRFVGDAVLAIFPLGDDFTARDAGKRAVRAIREASRRRKSLAEDGIHVNFGIGLHYGDLLYGNIGVPERIEFSVIGPCANEVARLEDLTKELGYPVLLSAELASLIDDESLVSMGEHSVRGVDKPMSVFRLSEE
ncbi:MAG: adenylate cyclase [marine bacterium B5-7]|nr:MAG: adenylate cyclase [marine bacterium B5-7]